MGSLGVDKQETQQTQQNTVDAAEDVVDTINEQMKKAVPAEET